MYWRLFGQDSVPFPRDFNFLSHKLCEILYVTCLWLADFMNVIIADPYEGWEQNCPFSKQKSKQMNMTINSYSQRKKIHISQLHYIRLQHLWGIPYYLLGLLHLLGFLQFLMTSKKTKKHLIPSVGSRYETLDFLSDLLGLFYQQIT